MRRFVEHIVIAIMALMWAGFHSEPAHAIEKIIMPPELEWFTAPSGEYAVELRAAIQWQTENPTDRWMINASVLWTGKNR